MKNAITRTLIILLLTAVSVAKGQESFPLAPPEAEWYYEYQQMTDQGYVKISIVCDTLIDGYRCQKLQKFRSGYSHPNGLHSGTFGYEYISRMNDSVLIYRNGGFHKLFDFGAEVGDSWTVVGMEGVCEEDYGTVRVVDKGIEVVNGVPLKYVTIKDDIDSYWGFSPTLQGAPSSTIKVVERIGPIGSYLLPEQKCWFDDAEGGPLRCYIDDELGELHYSSLNPERNCDYINENYQCVDQHNGNAISIVLTPNPTQDKVSIKIDSLDEHETYSLELVGIDGRLVIQKTSVSDDVTLDLSDLPSGVYVLNVKGNRVLHRQTLIKTE